MKKNIKNRKFINKIICADVLKLLPQIENNSIDLVLTDPPYFLDKMDNNWQYETVNNKKNQYIVKSLPAGMKFDRSQGKRFYHWYLKVAKEIYRILKPGGFFLSFSSPRLYHRMASAIDDANFLVRDCFLWIYTQNQAKAMGLNHFISKLNTDQTTKEKIKKKLEGWKTPQIKSCFEPIATAQKPPENTFLFNVLKYKVGLFNTKIKVGKNMFPSTFSKNAVILDPFVGSGTTAVAAKNLGKNFIGIDINSKYVAITKKRLKYKFKTNLKLNL